MINQRKYKRKTDSFIDGSIAVGGGILLCIGLFCLINWVCHILPPGENDLMDHTLHSGWYHWRWIPYILIPYILIMQPICYIVDWHENNPKGEKVVKMTFKHFNDMYNIAPNKWANDAYRGGLRYCDNQKGTFYIRFNFFDWRRYSRWLDLRERNKDIEMENEITADLLECFQKDINKAYEKINNEIDNKTL